jgi:membrane associated rhomboid family serine protease
MIPLRSTERVYSKTLVTVSLIVINVLIFFYQVTLGPGEREMFIRQWGIVPDQMRGLGLLTLFTSMFLHAGWLHIMGNMLFLWVFGRNVEDLIGGLNFLAFYLIAGVAAGIIQVVVNAYSTLPIIGASGAIAGVMGAYLVKFPRTKIVTLIFVGFIFWAEIPAAFILLYWFAIQFFSGVGSLATTNNYNGGGVAYFAHIGGFVVGMLLIRLFPARQRWRPWYEED